MKDILEIIFNFTLLIILIILILFVIGIIVLEIYCWVNYGGKPISGIPAWVLWFMWGRN